jgi:hypothetical protein
LKLIGSVNCFFDKELSKRPDRVSGRSTYNKELNERHIEERVVKLILKVFKSVLLLTLVVLIIDYVGQGRLNLLDSAEKRHIVSLGCRLLVLLLLDVKVALFVQAVNKV